MAESLKDMLARLDRALRPGLGAQAAPASGRPDETPLRRESVLMPISDLPGTPPTVAGTPRPVSVIKTSEIRQLKFARRYRAKLGIASASPVDGYLADIVPIVPIGRFDIEDYYPDRLFYGYSRLVQQAANVSVVQAFNASADIVAVFDNIQAWRENTAGMISFGYDNVDLGAGPGQSSVMSRDVRGNLVDGNGNGNVLSLRQSIQAAPFNFETGRLTSGVFAPVGQLLREAGMALWPGQGIVFFPASGAAIGGLINEGVGISLSWRQIPVDDVLGT